jgi:hypothetical protein
LIPNGPESFWHRRWWSEGPSDQCQWLQDVSCTNTKYQACVWTVTETASPPYTDRNR